MGKSSNIWVTWKHFEVSAAFSSNSGYLFPEVCLLSLCYQLSWPHDILSPLEQGAVKDNPSLYNSLHTGHSSSKTASLEGDSYSPGIPKAVPMKPEQELGSHVLRVLPFIALCAVSGSVFQLPEIILKCFRWKQRVIDGNSKIILKFPRVWPRLSDLFQFPQDSAQWWLEWRDTASIHLSEK